MRRGFTIVEIVTAIGLLGIRVGLGYAFSFSYLQTQQLRAAGDVVTSELRQAQTDAFTQKNDADHGVKIFTDHVVRFQGSSYASRTQAKDVQTDFSLTTTPSGLGEFVFTAGGLKPTTAGGATLTFQTHAIDITISPYGILTLTERTIGG